jgi:MYXO-CTERM domain-containing protein
MMFSQTTFSWDGSTWKTLAAPAGLLATRGANAMAFDDDLNQMVIFAGSNGQTPATLYNDTWAWDYANNGWTTATTAGTPPPVRTNPLMAYDAARKQLVVFGGEGATKVGLSTSLADTWLLTKNGSTLTWTQATPAHVPPPRNNGRMAYDTKTQTILMFAGWGSDPVNFTDGGANMDGPLQDLWSWDGTDWTQISTATLPPRRTTYGLAYDQGRDRLVAFGGWGVINNAGSDSGAPLTFCDNNANNCNRLGDTWEFDGTDWASPATATAPSARVGFNMTFDAKRGHVAGFGGWANPSSDETWEYYTRGAACGGDAGTTCPSGTCVDGVCCETSSCGECSRCDTPTPGVCAPVPDGTACSNGGTCQTGACTGQGSVPDAGADAAVDSGLPHPTPVPDAGNVTTPPVPTPNANNDNGGGGGCTLGSATSAGGPLVGLLGALGALGMRRRRNRK